MKQAYKILLSNLPLATHLMNISDSSGFFKSEVVEIFRHPDKKFVIVVLEVLGSYPFLTNQWKEVICE